MDAGNVMTFTRTWNHKSINNNGRNSASRCSVNHQTFCQALAIPQSGQKSILMALKIARKVVIEIMK
jgi:hypothetical protein